MLRINEVLAALGFLGLGLLWAGAESFAAKYDSTQGSSGEVATVAKELKITLSDPAEVMTAPSTEKAALWGVYQFPMIWQGEDGAYYLRVNVGQDTYGAIGVQEGGLYYRSEDGLKDWRQVAIEAKSKVIVLPNGNLMDVAFESPPSVSPRNFDLSPVFTLTSPNEVGMFDVYRYGNIPKSKREFSFRLKKKDADKWTKVHGVVDVPELLCPVTVKARLTSTADWQDVSPTLPIESYMPAEIVVVADGTLVATVCGQSPEVADRVFWVTYCVASTDSGRTWRKHGTIADQTEISRYGYGGFETSMVKAANGDLLCAMRTDICSYDLAATIVTVLSRSSDGGRTWSAPIPIAPTSVTPHLVALDNGVIALVYGRPGVHLLFSSDNGHSWGYPVRVIGSTLEEVRTRAVAMGSKNYIYDIIWTDPETCANTTVLKTGPNRFLLAYSDFKHKGDDGKSHKANMVVQVTVE